MTDIHPAVDYGPSMIVAKQGDSKDEGDGSDVAARDQSKRVLAQQSYAVNLAVGKRMPSVKVLNQADARPWHFQELLPSNGRWRLIIFTGDLSISTQKARLDQLGERLARPDSVLNRFTPANARYDSVIELLSVHAGPRTGRTIFDFPEVFRPYDEVEGYDYWKIYVDDESYHEGHGEMYKNYGIDPEQGCSIILRPDQYVSYVGPMDAYDEMDKFFSAFMIPQRVHQSVVNGKQNAIKAVDVNEKSSAQHVEGAAMVT